MQDFSGYMLHHSVFLRSSSPVRRMVSSFGRRFSCLLFRGMSCFSTVIDGFSGSHSSYRLFTRSSSPATLSPGQVSHWDRDTFPPFCRFSCFLLPMDFVNLPLSEVSWQCSRSF